MEILEVPPLSPTSKEVLSQAVKATFAGFAQERINHHFPQGTATLTLYSYFLAYAGVLKE